MEREHSGARDPRSPGRPCLSAGSDGLTRALAARDEMLAMIAHDLRNPLNVISMAAAATLEAASSGDAATVERMEAILRASGRMDRLIADLLDGAALDAGTMRLELRAEPAGRMLEDAYTWFADRARSRSVTLHRDAVEELAVRVDRRRIMQVLLNLLENALRACGAGDRIRLHAASLGDWVRFAVSDSGAGIAPEDVPHVFERFWHAGEAAHGAAGLGLAIARGIVEAHGGRIWVESEPGNGTTFGFTVPASSHSAPAEESGG